MNKDDLVASIARKMDISIAEATRILDRLLSVISEALERGESVDLSGFGKFDVETRAARSGPIRAAAKPFRFAETGFRCLARTKL